jgi:hypothetical protein
MRPDRYLAIRIRPAQGELFGDGNPCHYFAVVTNMWSWDGERLLRWQRERCGTVEKVHDVLKNDPAGDVLPSKRFFANAASWRLNAMTYNVLSVIKRKALPQASWPARLRALRFHLIKRLVKNPLSAAAIGQNNTSKLCQNNAVINTNTRAPCHS